MKSMPPPASLSPIDKHYNLLLGAATPTQRSKVTPRIRAEITRLRLEKRALHRLATKSLKLLNKVKNMVSGSRSSGGSASPASLERLTRELNAGMKGLAGTYKPLQGPPRRHRQLP